MHSNIRTEHASCTQTHEQNTHHALKHTNRTRIVHSNIRTEHALYIKTHEENSHYVQEDIKTNEENTYGV